MNNASCYTSTTTIHKNQTDSSFQIEKFNQPIICKNYKSKSYATLKNLFPNERSNKKINEESRQKHKSIILAQTKQKQQKNILEKFQTKHHTPIKKKKNNKKNYKKIIQNGQKKSQSNDYVLIGQEIYQCNNFNQITNYFLSGGNNLVSYSRYYKTMLNNLIKIQKYFHTFKQYQIYHKDDSQKINIEALNYQEKLKLYQILKEQVNNQKYLNEFHLKLMIQQLQKKCEKVLQKYPDENKRISKWKNQKLHQLSSASRFLNKTQKQIKNNQIFNPDQNIPQLFQKQLQQLLLQQIQFPLLKEKSQKLQGQLLRHLKLQRFTSEDENLQEKVSRGYKQKQQNYFGLSGLLWYLNSLKQFIKQNNYLFQEIIRRMSKSYGFTIIQKLELARTAEFQWWEYLQNYEDNKEEVLSNQIYIKFQKQVIGVGDSQQQQQQRQYMHIFNKCILDSLNWQIRKFKFGYPDGQPLPYLEYTLATGYNINYNNFDQIWDKCIIGIYNCVNVTAGVMIDDINDNYIRQHRSMKMNTMINMQIKEDFQMGKELIWVATVLVYVSIEVMIVEELLGEFILNMNKIINKSNYI